MIERRIAEGPKGQRQEKPDAHDHGQAEHGEEPPGVFGTLKLPAIGHAIAGLCRQERVHPGGNILHHRGDVASGHVTHDDDFALHLFAADGIGSRGLGDLRQRLQRQLRPAWGVHQEVSQGLRRPRAAFPETHDQVKGVAAFEHP